MKLIDADKLKQVFCEHCDDSICDTCQKKKFIEAAPTIEISDLNGEIIEYYGKKGYSIISSETLEYLLDKRCKWFDTCLTAELEE